MNPDVTLAESREDKHVPQSKQFIIAHISDIHAGSQYFVHPMIDRHVCQLDDSKPNVLVVTSRTPHQAFKNHNMTDH